ncbi:MAG: hypothetical protein MUC59_00765 [Saprospiraceae bacterium]|nr:hypothetical protein [Saprospiraceae bacterium]
MKKIDKQLARCKNIGPWPVVCSAKNAPIMFDRTTPIASIMTREVLFVHPDDSMQRV